MPTTTLAETNATATLGVKKLETARQFYEGKLGLKKVGSEGTHLVVYKCGDSTINVYESQYAGTNQATALTWNVDEDIEGTVSSLKTKGVAFEHYDLPNTTRQGDLHLCGEMKVAWFKDPDGNILSIAGY